MSKHSIERSPLRTRTIFSFLRKYSVYICSIALLLGYTAGVVLLFISNVNNKTAVKSLLTQNVSLTEENEQLSTYVERLELTNMDYHVKLYEQEQTIKDLEKDLKDYEKYKESLKSKPNVADSGFRSYMPQTAITSKSSKQYQLRVSADVDTDGILNIDGYALVAIGTGWNIPVGTKARVTTERGHYDIIVGDIKANRHTDVTNRVTVGNGCVVEFIVDVPSMDLKVKSSGNIATIPKYAGKVLRIEPIG